MGWADRYIEELKRDKIVSFRPHGNSMVPRIKSGQLCTCIYFAEGQLEFEGAPLTLSKGDVVLCKVNGHQYLHLVTAVKHGQVQISNNKGRVNGWTALKNVYGVLVRVSD